MAAARCASRSHFIRVLALFLKRDAAGATGDGDFSFASGDTEALPAIGAFEIPVIMVPVHGQASPEPIGDRLCELQKFLVFCAAFL